MGQKVETKDVHAEFTPSFEQGLSDTEVTESFDVTFTVIVKGAPEPQISWYKNGAVIKASKQYVFERKESRYTMTIHSVTKQEIAEYTCKATNKMGSVSTSCKLVVKERTNAPEFEEQLTSMTVEEQKPLEMKCKVVGKPNPLSNGSEMAK